MLKRNLFFLVLILILNSKAAMAENKISLDGMWKYKFYDSSFYSREDLDDSYWDDDLFAYRKILHEPLKQSLPVWFRKHLTIPNSMQSQDLMLYIGGLTNGHEIYFNGELIGKTPLYPNNYFNDWNRKYGYFIPKSLIHYGKQNVLSIKTNTSYEYGPTDSIFIAPSSYVTKKVLYGNNFSTNLYLGLSILLLSMAVYFFMLYYRVRTMKKHLYFALICLSTSIYYCNYFIYGLPISYLLFQKIVFLALHMVNVFLLPFSKELFGLKFTKREKYICLILVLTFLLGETVSSSLIGFYIFRTYYLRFATITCVYYLWLSLQALLSKNKTVFRVGVGIPILILLIGHDIFYETIDTLPKIGFYLNPYVLIAFLLLISVELVKEYNMLYIKSTTDGLTGLQNHVFFKNALKDFLNEKRSSDLCSLLLLDVDNFKKLNDKCGHITGDYVLREIAAIIKRNSPEDAIVARYGGEEFAIMLKGATNDEAFCLAERIRQDVSSYKFKFKAQDKILKHITVSIGVTTFSSYENQTSLEAFIDQADKALYYSKENNKNRSTHFNNLGLNM